MSRKASTTRPRADIAALRAGDSSSVSSVSRVTGDESAPAPAPAESRIDRIARRAHEIYEARNGQHGTALEDWLNAERQIDDEIDRA